MAAEVRERLLPPPRPPTASSSSAAASNHRDSSATAGRRPLFQGMDVLGLKKRGQGLRSWIRVDASTGASQVMEVDKFTMMRRCDLPARDLRLLDPLFVYPSTVLGRERAIVVNLEQIRCIITADEVLLLNSLDSYVLQYVIELQRRLAAHSGDAGAASPDYLPFEFRALEVALEAACTFLDAQAAELEIEAYPLLDELTSKISTLNLERVRRLKSRLVSLTRRVQKVRDEIEQLMDDDGDMAEMYLTEKKRQMETSFNGEQSLLGYNPSGAGAGTSLSAPVSPVSSPPESRKLEKTFSSRSRHESLKSSYSNKENIEELEMLLEAYFVVIDSTLNKLTSLKEYIDDTEDFINIQLVFSASCISSLCRVRVGVSQAELFYFGEAYIASDITCLCCSQTSLGSSVLSEKRVFSGTRCLRVWWTFISPHLAMTQGDDSMDIHSVQANINPGASLLCVVQRNLGGHVDGAVSQPCTTALSCGLKVAAL